LIFFLCSVICYLIEILLAVREWECEGIGMTNGNGRGMGKNLAKPGIGNGNGNEPSGIGGNGIEKNISAHLYLRRHTAD